MSLWWLFSLHLVIHFYIKNTYVHTHKTQYSDALKLWRQQPQYCWLRTWYLFCWDSTKWGQAFQLAATILCLILAPWPHGFQSAPYPPQCTHTRGRSPHGPPCTPRLIQAHSALPEQRLVKSGFANMQLRSWKCSKVPASLRTNRWLALVSDSLRVQEASAAQHSCELENWFVCGGEEACPCMWKLRPGLHSLFCLVLGHSPQSQHSTASSGLILLNVIRAKGRKMGRTAGPRGTCSRQWREGRSSVGVRRAAPSPTLLRTVAGHQGCSPPSSLPSTSQEPGKLLRQARGDTQQHAHALVRVPLSSMDCSLSSEVWSDECDRAYVWQTAGTRASLVRL